jgi:hypothetical protein
MINIQQTTLDLLKAFAVNGGKIIQIGKKAVFLNGKTADNIFDFPLTEITEIGDLKNFNTESYGICPLLEFCGSKEILLHTRETEGKLEYFLTNFSERAQNIKVYSDMADYVLYDPRSNQNIIENGRFPNSFSLQPAACCHILPKDVTMNLENKDISESLFSPGLQKSLIPLKFAPETVIKADNENTLLIDAGYLDNGESILFSDSEEIPAGTEISIPVNIPQPGKVSHIYAETDESLNMLVNGKKVNWTSTHSATQDLRQASLRGLLCKGRNKIQIISSGKRVEMLYMGGDFSVQLLDDEEACCADINTLPLELGNAAQQGLPFYWGSLSYKLKFKLNSIPETCWLDLGKVEGVVKLFVNGHNAGLCYGKPWMFDLNGVLRQGDNNIEIKLYNTGQNFFGPHRVKNILGKNRAWEGSSNAAWIPSLAGSKADSWGIASFGVYGPIKLFSNENIMK